jgi:hypothetical protein
MNHKPRREPLLVSLFAAVLAVLAVGEIYFILAVAR